jgi:hypothetical protein
VIIIIITTFFLVFYCCYFYYLFIIIVYDIHYCYHSIIVAIIEYIDNIQVFELDTYRPAAVLQQIWTNFDEAIRGGDLLAEHVRRYVWLMSCAVCSTCTGLYPCTLVPHPARNIPDTGSPENTKHLPMCAFPVVDKSMSCCTPCHQALVPIS